MKKLIFSLAISILTASQASAGGASLGTNDVYASMAIVGILILILGLIYFTDFINRIYKDPDYRDRMRSSVVSFVDALRAYFPKKKTNGDLTLFNEYFLPKIY